MAFTYTPEQLTQAFITFRDSLPKEHERRQTLQNVNGMRFDTQIPDLLHFSFNEEENDRRDCYRRLSTEKSLEDVAKDLVLFPSHQIIYYRVGDHAFKTFLLNLSPQLKEHHSVLDVFVPDDLPPNCNLVICATRPKVEDLLENLETEWYREVNPDVYYIRRFILRFIPFIPDHLKKGTCLTEIPYDAELFEEVKHHWANCPTFKPQVNAVLGTMLPLGMTPRKDDYTFLGQMQLNGDLTEDQSRRAEEITINTIGLVLVDILNTLLPGLCEYEVLPERTEKLL